VTIKTWYTSPGSTVNQVERVEFANGTVWSNIDLQLGPWSSRERATMTC
jgi:hypothetical protein